MELRGLVCMKVKSVRLGFVVPGSVKRMCSQCREQVWVSRSSIKVVTERNATIFCQECAQPILLEQAEKKGVALMMTPEQQAEYKAMLRAHENN